MKKLTIIIACFLLNNISANAADLGLGSGAEVINNQNKMQMQQLQVEKKYVETTTKDVEAEQKKANDDKKKDVMKGNLTYNPQFKLNKIVFQGNTKIPDKKLQKLAIGLVGKEVYLEDVMDLTVQVSRFYQKNGYLTSYAYLEPQEIKDGIVIINIKESKLAQKEIAGNKWEKDWYFKNVALSGEGLQQDKVFNAKDLQGAMKNINKEAYLKGSAEISKDKDDNTIVKLNVADRLPINVDLAWDDYGRNYTGRQRFTSIVGFDNLTGFGDKIYGGAILSQGANGVLAGYQIPVNKYGTKLAFDYSYSRVNLGGPYSPLNIQGRATDYVIRLIQPIRNTATQEIAATISLDALNSKSDSLALNRNISDYSLRVLRTGISGMFDDKNGRTLANIGVDAGATALGASGNVDNGAQSSFYKFVAAIARIQRLPRNCLGIFRLNAQYSPQSLYPSEQMYLGGVYSVRGYQPSELLGDYGLNGTFEVRTPVPGLKKVLPAKVKSWSDKIKLAFFYDWGYVKENENIYGYPTNFISSVGLGTYINVTDAIFVQFGVGIPVGPKNYNDDNARVYFSVNTDIDRIFLKPRERL
jgi:hemolysin activation/secretion protein